MPKTAFPEQLYVYRSAGRVFVDLDPAGSPEAGTLAAIETKVQLGHQLFLARRYQDAVRAYQEARSLIYAQLEPAFPWTTLSVNFPNSAGVLTSLLSLGLEWMNVLPVQQPLPAPRPRVPLDPAVDAPLAKFAQLGLTSDHVSKSSDVQALADYQYAQTLTVQGNDKAAAFYTERSRQLSPDLNQLLTPVRPAVPEIGVTTPVPVLNLGLQPGLTRTAPLHLTMPNMLDITALQRVNFAVPKFTVTLPPSIVNTRSLGVRLGDTVRTFGWATGDGPPIADIRRAVYEDRIAVTDLTNLIPVVSQPSDLALQLPHLYGYVLPLAIAECDQAMGDYPGAEANYWEAAGYVYLNLAVEGPYLWNKIAGLYLAWGNSLYRDGDSAAALDIYQRVLNPDGSVPGTRLYTEPGLAAGAAAARQVAAQLGAPPPAVNPQLAATLVEVWQRLLQLRGGLDYYGHWANTLPIWTFEYLQSVAVNFTQFALSAERDFISYQERADTATLTRTQLQQSVTQSQAEVVAASLQAQAADVEVAVYQAGVTLAQRRASDAQAAIDDYAAKSWAAIGLQAASAQVAGGDDGNVDELNALADQLLAGQTISGSRGTVGAAAQLAGARRNREYELASLRRTRDELQAALVQAQAQLQAAQARTQAAEAGVQVAQLRATGAQQMLGAFDGQFFTPEVWWQMGQVMYGLYQRYLSMALRSSKLMQQAFNFENDTALSLIRSSYAGNEVRGLLAADQLMADVQAFTFDLITGQTVKLQPVKQVISLSEEFPYLFETALRVNGSMEFETRLEQFEGQHPGLYGARIEAVEVLVDGLVPPAGLSGTLTNAGLSTYRLPLSQWGAGTGEKYRVQNRETLVLSDFDTRSDGLLLAGDARQLRTFQGAGVASSWRLSFPRALNDLDYAALLDVRLVVYYRARFDPDLRDRVLQDLQALPGMQARTRALPLRWLYPEAYFQFQRSGTLNFTLNAPDFPRNETDRRLTGVAVLFTGDGSHPTGNLELSLRLAGAGPVTARTVADGSVQSAPASPLAPLLGGALLGPVELAVTAADNPDWVRAGQLDLSALQNVTLLLEYSYTPRGGA